MWGGGGGGMCAWFHKLSCMCMWYPKTVHGQTAKYVYTFNNFSLLGHAILIINPHGMQSQSSFPGTLSQGLLKFTFQYHNVFTSKCSYFRRKKFTHYAYKLDTVGMYIKFNKGLYRVREEWCAFVWVQLVNAVVNGHFQKLKSKSKTPWIRSHS